jgi:hypothetical protein
MSIMIVFHLQTGIIIETYGHPLDLADVGEQELAEERGRFYCEAKSNLDPNKTHQSTDYHKNTMKSIRSAINRHLPDIRHRKRLEFQIT